MAEEMVDDASDVVSQSLKVCLFPRPSVTAGLDSTATDYRAS